MRTLFGKPVVVTDEPIETHEIKFSSLNRRYAMTKVITGNDLDAAYRNGRESFFKSFVDCAFAKPPECPYSTQAFAMSWWCGFNLESSAYAIVKLRKARSMAEGILQGKSRNEWFMAEAGRLTSLTGVSR